jgi:hypothetical protein
MAVMEGALHGASDGLVHFVSRDWIREALAGLPCD